MKRRRPWLDGILLVCGLVAVLEYLALAWVVPRYVLSLVGSAFRESVVVEGAALRFPLTLILMEVHTQDGWPSVGFRAQRVLLTPAWISWRHKTVILRTVTVEQPELRLLRTSQGALQWPDVTFIPDPPPSAAGGSFDPSSETAPSPPQEDWTVSIKTLSVVDGTMAFLDQWPAQPFSGKLEHLSLVAGPVTWPPRSGPVTLAVRGEFIGHGDREAPLYCSGWFDPKARDLEASCQLQPLALAAFEPYYYQGRLQARVYEATLESTSRWSAHDNALEGRIQLSIKNLHEGDLSVRGSTLADIRHLAGGEPPTLTGEVQVAGPFDDLTQWQLDLVPGNDVVQRLIKPLLDRGREMIQVKVGGETIKVGISPATEAEMSSIEEASKRVEQSLELFTTPLPSPTPTEPPPPAPSDGPSPTPSDNAS